MNSKNLDPTLAAKVMKYGLIVAMTQAAPLSAAVAADYYLAPPLQSSEVGKGTQASPFTSTWYYNHVLKPGDTLHVLPGTYTTMLYLTASGSAAGGYIAIVGDPTSRPIFHVTSGSAIQLKAGTSYVSISGLDVSSSATNGSGIYTEGATPVHHLRIFNNYVHDCGGAGLGLVHNDYLTIVGNVVWNNSALSSQDTSGIDIYQPTNTDTAPGVHITVAQNIVYNNYNTIPQPGQANVSDGNGIILDDGDHTQLGYLSTAPAYTGGILVENNVVYNNGGRAIHVYYTNNVVVRNNTTYMNEASAAFSAAKFGEIMTVNASNVQIYNNIMYPRGNGYYGYVGINSSNIDADYNQYFNGGSYRLTATSGGPLWGTHNFTADPLFVAPTTNPATADFHVHTTSPALAAGLPNAVLAGPAVDVLNAGRPSAGPIAVGAVQIPK
jgi:hypothetical protein